MKTLILPVDIKSRELDARLLHAACALESGWRVITGSKTLINRAIWRLPRGVYLFSTLAPGRLLMARCLKAMGWPSQGWDEEGLIYGHPELYRRQRLSARTMALVDQIFAWGEASARDMRIVAAEAGKTVEVAGNPRLDLLRPELRPLLEPEAEHLRRQHGDFILVATNLSWANPHVIPPEQADLHGPTPPPGREGPWSYLQYQKRMLAAFREALPAIAKAFPDMKVVIRPHPVENVETWKEALAGCPNVEIIREGAILPWTHAARVFVHSNSTTGLEARLLGHHPVAFVPFDSPRHESPLPNGVSLQANSVRKLVRTIADVLEGRARFSHAQEQLLHEHLHLPDGLCTPLFVKRAEELWERQGLSSWKAPAIRARLALRHAAKALRHNHARDIHRRNIFPDTSCDEIRERLRQIAGVLGFDKAKDASIREISPNIFTLEIGRISRNRRERPRPTSRQQS